MASKIKADITKMGENVNIKILLDGIWSHELINSNHGLSNKCLQKNTLIPRLPNTAGVTRISNIAPKVGANFTQVQIKLSGLFVLAFGHQSHFAKEKNLSYRLGH